MYRTVVAGLLSFGLLATGTAVFAQPGAADRPRTPGSSAASPPAAAPGAPVPDSGLPKGARTWLVTSPDGKSRLTLALADLGGTGKRADGGAAPGGSRLYYQVENGPDNARVVVVRWSPLGITREDERFVDDLTFASTSARSINEAYALLGGKSRQVRARGQERTVVFQTPKRSRLEVVLRAYDDGVAFRYGFPGRGPATFTVTGEETGFQIPAGAVASLTPHSDSTKYTPAYEELWQAEVPVGTSSPKGAGWSFPALFRANGKWILLTEGGLDAGYAGTRLAKEAPGGLYRVRLPDAGEGEGYGDVNPRSTLPWATPWRIIVAGDSAAAVVESHAVTHVAAPSKIRDTRWIRAGRSGWSWWAESDSPKSYPAMVPYVDAASEMGWEYFLVDANWDEMKGGSWKELAAYAAKKNVRLLLWYNSGGPNNSVTEKPRDLMSDRAKRRAEMKRIADGGVAGIKVDFFQSDKQVTIRQYLELLADAADFKLLVNFHGCTLPRGWERTWPNLMGHEAVRGAEQYKFSRDFAARAPSHNAILPFTRNAIGPADYTPVTFTDSRFPHRTTNAHELALSVVIINGLQHFADSAAAYRGLPEAPRAFLKAVPAAWDETRFLVGEPGKLAVLARRSGREWYVGGINGEAQPKTLALALGFLGTRGRYQVTLIGDGANDRSFSNQTTSQTGADTLTVAVRGNGGFVLRAVPAP